MTARGGPLEIIPSFDLMDGEVVRLREGSFGEVTRFGGLDSILNRLHIPAGTRIHLVDLTAGRDGGAAAALPALASLVARGYRVQTGGGVRSVADARRRIDAGAEKVVIGTVAAEDPAMLASIVDAIGSSRVIVAVDFRDGKVRTHGWERETEATGESILKVAESLGLTEFLATDISKDGRLEGPSLDLYRSLELQTRLRVIASGGVSALGDVDALSRLPNVSALVVGRALLEGNVSYEGLQRRASSPNKLPPRVLSCLDVKEGRVVKGVRFEGLRDAGDPVECALRYELEGADEIVLLDVSATDQSRKTAADLVARVADAISIPFTVGGGVRSVEDFRLLFRAGADRVAINSAAVTRPQLIREAAEEYGVQAVVLACDARRTADGYRVAVRAGKELTDLEVVEWCATAEQLGAGEILLTSIDADGTAHGFDLKLLRAAASRIDIGVIASGGAGTSAHFLEAIEQGGAAAVLAATVFHDQLLTISDLKDWLSLRHIPVRRVERSAKWTPQGARA